MLEDMLKACVIDFGGYWDQILTLCKFSYNNSYDSSIGRSYLTYSMEERVDHLLGRVDHLLGSLRLEMLNHLALT